MAKNIVPRTQDFPQWYQDVIKAGELAEHAPVKGCMVIRPTGFAIWEEMQAKLDRRFKETGHVNAYFPLLIPMSFFEKEAEHVEGFAPELAVVTHGGGKKLEEELAIRPTSETIIGYQFAKWAQSYRDLPILVNQWCNVMRWEKRTRLFLRTSEFLWQEGHTAHETYEEAQEETMRMLEIYREFLEEVCAIPVIPGAKPAHEKFPGADVTYTVEAMMQDCKALQSATSHNLGQNFAKGQDIQFLGRDNNLQHAYTTSWGSSTRMIGGLIMVHGDDDGIIIPPRLAPTQVVLVPIYKNDEEKAKVLEHTAAIEASLKACLGSLKVKVDDRENMRPGDRFFTWIQKGVPLRLEIGPKDVEQKAAMSVRRDNRAKEVLSLEALPTRVPQILEEIQKALFQRAVDFRSQNTHQVDDYESFKKIMAQGGGFVYAHWDGTTATAERIQEETKASIRCIPLDSKPEEGRCMVTGQPSPRRVLFAQSY